MENQELSLTTLPTVNKLVICTQGAMNMTVDLLSQSIGLTCADWPPGVHGHREDDGSDAGHSIR